jgi:hypothetical protein
MNALAAAAAKIDWTKLQHAYGEATNVPRIVAALASADAGEREGGFYDLYGSLCHQGSVYTATLAVIPLLFEILRSPGYADRTALLLAIAAIGRGNGEDVSMADIRAAIAREAEALIDLLRDGSRDEKLAALGIFSGPEFEAATDTLIALATSADAPSELRARAWEALVPTSPARLPELKDDDATVQACAQLCRLEAAGDAPNALQIQAAERALADRSAMARLALWAETTEGVSPYQHCRYALKHSASILASVCQALVDSYDVERATALADLLLSTAFETKEDLAPDAVIDLSTLNETQRAVLSALVESDAVWSSGGGANGNLLYLLSQVHLPSGFDARDELREALSVPKKRRVVIVTPRQVRASADLAKELNRTDWLDAPFVFLREGDGGEESFEDAIEEDADYFTPAVMQDFRSLRGPITLNVVRHTCPVETVAFYPQLTVAAFAAIAARLGYEIVAPNLVFADNDFDPTQLIDDDEDADSEAEDDGAEGGEEEPSLETADGSMSVERIEGPAPCLLYTELSKEQSALLETFATRLDAAGFSEVTASHTNTKTMGAGGIRVTPLAMARRFGSACKLEVGFHIDEDLGEFLRLRLISNEGAALALRVLAVSEAAFETVATLDLKQPPQIAIRPLVKLGVTILLEHDGGLFEITLPDADS